MRAAFTLCLFALASAAAEPAATTKMTGFFACEKCTAPRVAKGNFTPSNPECAKQCIQQGSEAVFLDQEGKQSLKVRNCPSATEDLGYHVEVVGTIDASAKTIAIESVKRLDYAGASCSRSAHQSKK